MSDLGVLGVGNSVAPSLWNSAPNGALQTIDAASDTSYGHVDENTTGDYDQGWALANVPESFANMETLSIQLRYAWSASPTNTSWPLLAARVMNGATVLAASSSGGGWQTVASSITTTTPTNSAVISFAYVNTTADEATWNGAVVEIRIGRDRLKAGGTQQQRVFACSVTGTYDLTAPPSTAPASITANARTTSSIDLEVGEVSGATSYEIYRNDVLIYDGPSRFHQDAGLSSNTEYKYTALGKNSLGAGPLSGEYFFSTNPLLPSAPTLVTPPDNSGFAPDFNPFEWNYNGGEPEDEQTAFAIRRGDGVGWNDAFVSDSDGNGAFSSDLSPDSTRFAVATNIDSNTTHDRVDIYSTDILQRVHTFDVIRSTTAGVAFIPGTDFLATRSGNMDDETPYFVNIYNASNNYSLVTQISIKGQGGKMRVTPDGKYIVNIYHTPRDEFHGGDNPHFEVIDTSDWSIVPNTPVFKGNYWFSIDATNEYVAIGASSNPRLYIIRVSDWTIVHTISTPGRVEFCRFSSDGTVLATGHLNSPYLTLYDVANGQVITGTPTLPNTGRGIGFSPDDKYVVIGVNFSTTQIYRINAWDDWTLVENDFTALNRYARDVNWLPMDYAQAVHGTDYAFLIACAGGGAEAVQLGVQVEMPQWWNGTAWVSDEVFITSPIESYQFPSGAWDV